MEISSLLIELDTKRLERGMSYQAVADACGVSKTTIYRTLTGATEPTVQLVQRIEAAVQYVPAEKEPLIPDECSGEDYNRYLRATIARQTEDYKRHIAQLQAHYSMLRQQDRRVILGLVIAVAVLVIFLVGWLIFDIMHPNIGWIQG